MFFSDVSPTTFALFMLPAITNLWGIYHTARHNFPRENERALWMAACIFLPIIGPVFYLIFGLRRSKIINNDDNDKKDDYINNKNKKNGE